MSDEALIIIGASAFFLCLGAIVSFVLLGILDGEREYRAASQESYVEASLRPSTGLVAVSSQGAPYDQQRDLGALSELCIVGGCVRQAVVREVRGGPTDYEAGYCEIHCNSEVQKAQAFVWALHRIEAASNEDRWDWALGQGRN